MTVFWYSKDPPVFVTHLNIMMFFFFTNLLLEFRIFNTKTVQHQLWISSLKLEMRLPTFLFSLAQLLKFHRNSCFASFKFFVNYMWSGDDRKRLCTVISNSTYKIFSSTFSNYCLQKTNHERAYIALSQI